MARKIGSGAFSKAIDLGGRELASVMFTDSNIAQPGYPDRTPQEPETPQPDGDRSAIEERLAALGPPRGEPPGRDDRGPERD